MALQAGLSLEKAIQIEYDRISCGDFEKMCPLYRHALGDLSIKLNFVNSNEEKLQLLENFGHKYLMLPMYERKRMDLEIIVNKYDYKKKTKSQFLLYMPHHDSSSQYNRIPWAQRQMIALIPCHQKSIAWKGFEALMFRSDSIQNIEKTEKNFERALSFPHRYLERTFQLYKINSTKPITKIMEARVEKLKALFEKFKAAEMNDEKWLECMAELEDDEAKIANFEYRLGFEMKCCIREIWKSYILFLKEKNYSKLLLDVYRRFCRFFISDLQSRTKYREEIERIGKLGIDVSEFWIDSLKFELHFGNPETLFSILEKAQEISKDHQKEDFLKSLQECQTQQQQVEQPNLNRKRKLQNSWASPKLPKYDITENKLQAYYRINSSKTQNFCFHNPMIHYIISKSSPALLQNLYFTCKYFYAKSKIRFCHRLIIDLSNPVVFPNFFQHSCLLSSKNFELRTAMNLHITNNLTCESPVFLPSTITINRRALSSVISILHKCDAKYLKIFHQDLSYQELKFLICSGKVEKVEMKGTRIFNSLGQEINRDELQAILESFDNHVSEFKFE